MLFTLKNETVNVRHMKQCKGNRYSKNEGNMLDFQDREKKKTTKHNPVKEYQIEKGWKEKNGALVDLCATSTYQYIR